MAAPVLPEHQLEHGILVLSGYGLRLAVERGHFVAHDGVATKRRVQRFTRIDRDLKRVVVIGHSGLITLDAIAWLQGVHVPLIHLDYDGRLLLVSSFVGQGIAELRRAQALAYGTERGLAIARELVATKVRRQLQVLDQVPEGEAARPHLVAALDAVRDAESVVALRDWEARAARAYWRAWCRLPIQFAPDDARRRPAHWRVFGSRASPLAGLSPRKAVNPANAVLNYLYAMLEAEVTIATLAERLDPQLGLFHADRAERASFPCDVMEPIRPTVDALAVSLFRDHVFTKEEAFERGDGHCRLLPPLTRRLAATAALWAREAHPIVAQVAHALATRRSPHIIVPGVPLPRVGSRRRPRTRTVLVRPFDGEPSMSWRDGERPMSGWRGTNALRRVWGANRAWDRAHGSADPADYRAEIWPGLRGLPLRDLVAATGMSTTTCSQIRQGRKIPHPRHWEALRTLASTATHA